MSAQDTVAALLTPHLADGVDEREEARVFLVALRANGYVVISTRRYSELTRVERWRDES